MWAEWKNRSLLVANMHTTAETRKVSSEHYWIAGSKENHAPWGIPCTLGSSLGDSLKEAAQTRSKYYHEAHKNQRNDLNKLM